MPSAAKYGLQAIAYLAFVAFVGYFSTSPPYEPLPPGDAVVKLSLRHSGQRKEPCRERTPEELAKLAPNMRAASVCPRERANVVVDVTMNGQPLFAVVAPPTGLSKDGASTVYRRIAVPAGEHRFTARLADTKDGKFSHTAERTVTLKPGRVLVIDFDAQSGGFVFAGG
ncbi:MAG: hypothetical protein IT518_19210 [Burkholderiales bacterium]|nr:hypothetical protein [Burkholderiales bacterium]